MKSFISTEKLAGVLGTLTKYYEKFTDFLIKRDLIFSVIIGIVPAVLLFAAAYYFVLAPAREEMDRQTKSVLAIEEEVRKGESVEQGADNFTEEFSNIVTLFYESQPRLPKETEISSILAYLQNLADQNNVRVISMSASKTSTKSQNAAKLYEREIPVAVIGKYDDVLRFWLAISRLERILVVRSFEVTAIEGSKRPAQVGVNFSLLAFHAPPDAEFPQIPQDVRKRAAATVDLTPDN